jgi:predicted nucleic acid-binding protein
MVIIDTDVFLIELAFNRDARFAMNSRFLRSVKSAGPAITIFNLMELLGSLSYHTPPAKLGAWREWLERPYRLTIIWPEPADLDARAFFEAIIYEAPLLRMQMHRLGFNDALMLDLAERTHDTRALVTWNARHFKNKTRLPVATPVEYLASLTETAS